MADPLPRTLLRPLGGYEQYSTSRHVLGLYENVITVCRYALPVPALDEKQLRARIDKAVATVVSDKLPALRVGIAGETTKQPVFVTVPSLDLRDHVEWTALEAGLSADQYDAQLMRSLERENARTWPDVEAHPPWRLVVYAPHPVGGGWADLAFTAHHALGDGKSGLVFHAHLVEALNAQDSEDDDDVETLDDPVLRFTELPRLVPSQEALVRFTHSWSFFLNKIWGEFGPQWLKGAPRAVAYTGPRVALEPKLRGHLRVFHLSPAEAAALLAGCRQHGVTLTALLHGLLLVLFARRLPADVAPTFNCLMPVAMVPYTTPEPLGWTRGELGRNMANLVSSYHYTFEPAVVADSRDVASSSEEKDDDDKVWRAAAAVGAGLKQRLARITEDNILGLLGWVGDWQQWWAKQEGKVREGTWTVSNTGSVQPTGGDAPPTGGVAPPRWRLTRNFYTQSSIGNSSLVNLNVGGVRGGELSFIVAWHDGVVEDRFGDAVADDLKACLVRYGQSGRFAVPKRLPKSGN